MKRSNNLLSFIMTKRLGNVQLLIKLPPRSSTFLTYLSTKLGEKISKLHIVHKLLEHELKNAFNSTQEENANPRYNAILEHQ